MIANVRSERKRNMDTNLAKSNEWAEKSLKGIVSKLGKLTSEEHGEARLDFCMTRNAGKPCEHFGKVEPVLGVIFESGCQKCGCALKVKTKTLYLGFEKLHKKITCPHELGNLWQAIDQNFIF